jgi:hypothetical protein
MKRTVSIIIYFVFANLILFQSCDKDKDKEKEKTENVKAKTGNIEGTVTDSEKSQTITGVMVEIKSNGNTESIIQSRITGDDGKYIFLALPVGMYSLFFSKDGYNSNNSDVTVTVIENQTVTREVHLTPIKPVIVVSPAMLDFGTSETILLLDIRNEGKGELSWEIVENMDWLSVNPPSGTLSNEPVSIKVTVDRSLITGAVQSSISIMSNERSVRVDVYVNKAGSSHAVLPTVTTGSSFGITQNSATVNGTVTNDGGATVTQRGVCYGTSSNPTIDNNIKTGGSGTGDFSCNLTGLSPNTTYHARAYAINSEGTSYGSQLIFTTARNPSAAPTVTTGAFSNITQNSVTVSGSVTNDGGAAVTQRGICYGTSSNPTIDNNIKTGGSGTGDFSCSLTGLSANTTYYARAYAINSEGMGYGSQISFTTARNLSAPTVTTGASSNITHNSVTVSGTVTNDGGATVTQRGVCYGTSSNPTIDNNIKTGGSGTGDFSCDLTGLMTNITYYARAYAINSEGTSYGAQISFTTTPNRSAPTVTTDDGYALNANAAIVKGTVINDGGATVTQRGVCYSAWSDPTISSNTETSGSGTGEFSCILGGLWDGTTYYARAYAINSEGTSYGAQVSFTTAVASSPEISIAPASLNFGDVTVGQTDSKVFTIYNDGNASLTYSIDSYPYGFSVSFSSGTISAGSSKTLTVTFEPNSATSYSGTISISSNAGSRYVSVSGTGTAAQYNPTFSPAMGTYTPCSGNDKNCNGKTFKAGTIKATVIGYSTSSNIINIRIKKCSGSFTHSGTAYVNVGSSFTCTNATNSVSFGAGENEINLNMPLQNGTKTYWITVASSTLDYFYADYITVSY